MIASKRIGVIATMLVTVFGAQSVAEAQICVAPPSGIVGWWPGNGNANDAIAGNNGQPAGDATFAAAVAAQGFKFDGVGDYVQIPDSAALKPARMSVEAWVRFDSLDTPIVSQFGAPGLQYIVFKKNSRTFNFEAYALRKERPSGIERLAFSVADINGVGGVSVAYSTTAIVVGQFYHVVGTYDGTAVRLYVNGQLEGQAPVSVTVDYGTRPVFIGTSGETVFDGKLNGIVDEASIYNRALNASETASLYAAGSAGKCGAPTGPSITLSPPSVPNGTVGTPYPSTSITQSGGTAPATFTVTSGTLPPGLNLSSGGTLGGTPTATGTFNFTIRATDANGFTGTRAYTLTINPAGPPTMTLDKTTLRFGAVTTGAAFVSQTAAQIVRLIQIGVGTVTWTATSNQPWLQVSPASGTGSASLSISVLSVGGLPVGSSVTGAITLTLTGASNTAGPITVSLKLIANGTSVTPLGFVDTPVDNATGVTGAIPFTGWTLDDVEVMRVMICRAAVGTEVAPIDPNCGGAAQIFVGFAVFIDGARTDVATANPTLPVNGRGGWGLMVLTNMLPNQGNGRYLFYVHAQDRDGHTTLLGTRTLTIANASATKPFGAIDTPIQGGVASGANFVNFGWALTPQPKIIPINGSTITVMVDGAPLGTVDYNHERADIETLFPGFQNTTGANGPVGFSLINTTTLTNGLHTISWTVVDSQGAIEGIGSRFFTVSNGAGALTAAVEGAGSRRAAPTAEDIAAAPQDDAPVLGRRGWDLEAAWRWYGVGRAGRAVIRGEEIDRFELALGDHPDARYTGHVRVGAVVAPLPIGSRLEASTGSFTWAPGVGFVGTYDLVFVRWAGTQAVARHEVRIILAPKGRGHVGVQVAIDVPRERQAVDQPFVLAGWAADLDAAIGTGIDTVHVWAYPATGGAPIFLGTPALGGVRPDVAAVHGEQFRAAGFALSLAGLVPGAYDLAVFPWSNVTGTFAPPNIVEVTVR